MLIKVKVELAGHPVETASREQFWRAASGRDYFYPSDIEHSEQKIKESLPDRLRERVIAACRSEAAYAEPTKAKASILPWKQAPPKPSFEGIEVRCLLLEYGSLVAWLSLKGAASIAGAMGTDLSGVSALVQTVAIGVTKDVLSTILPAAMVDGLAIEAQAYQDASADTADGSGEAAKTESSKRSVIEPSILGTITLVSLGVAYWAMSAFTNDASKFRGDLQQTVQAFFTTAQEHAKSVGQLEVELIKARADLLKTEGEERIALLKADGEERTALHKLLVDAVKDTKSSTKSSETTSDKTELIFLPPSTGCCAATTCRQVTTPPRVGMQPPKICGPSDVRAKTGPASAAR